MSFKNFLTESLESDTLAKIDTYLSQGKISKRDWEDLKNTINNKVIAASDNRGASSTPWAMMWKIPNVQTLIDESEEVKTLYFDAPQELYQFKPTFQKKINKVKNKQNPFVVWVQEYFDKFLPIAEKMNTLKGMIVTATQERTEKKDERTQVIKKRFSDSASLITVLEQHKDEFIKMAGERASQNYDSYMKELEKNDWSLDKIAPLPEKSKRYTEEGKTVMNRRQWYIGLTDGGGNVIRHESQAKRLQMIEEAKQGAEADYMAWVIKMTDKIGKTVQSAKMTGSPWDHSMIDVVTEDGEEQRWKTQMIINVSKYGKPFNQFPTTQVK
jgi:hypothetical protein